MKKLLWAEDIMVKDVREHYISSTIFPLSPVRRNVPHTNALVLVCTRPAERMLNVLLVRWRRWLCSTVVAAV